jgi:hypothetical protein
MRIIVGYKPDHIIVGAIVFRCPTSNDDYKFIGDMVAQGLTVQIIEAESVTIGSKLEE